MTFRAKWTMVWLFVMAGFTGWLTQDVGGVSAFTAAGIAVWGLAAIEEE